jgi:hypothetical protein
MSIKKVVTVLITAALAALALAVCASAQAQKAGGGSPSNTQAPKAQAAKQKSLEEAIHKIISAYSNKDMKTLNAFVLKDFGVGIISRPGSTNLMYLYRELDSENSLGGERYSELPPEELERELSIKLSPEGVEERFSFCDKLGGKEILFGELPSYDCEQWDKPDGMYCAEVRPELAKLAKITNEFVGDEIISEKAIKKLKEIDGKIHKVIAMGADGCVFAFYLAYFNNKWYLVVIDKAIGNCDA